MLACALLDFAHVQMRKAHPVETETGCGEFCPLVSEMECAQGNMFLTSLEFIDSGKRKKWHTCTLKTSMRQLRSLHTISSFSLLWLSVVPFACTRHKSQVSLGWATQQTWMHYFFPLIKVLWSRTFCIFSFAHFEASDNSHLPFLLWK